MVRVCFGAATNHFLRKAEYTLITEITEIAWRGEQALQLENKRVSAVILPQFGGKITSFVYKDTGFELVAQPTRPYKKPKIGDDFSLFDASGFDDVFPSVLPCEQWIDGRKVTYPDHGEIWTSVFSYKKEKNRLQLEHKSENLPYHYKKEIFIDENKLCFDYIITNTGNYAFPCIWLFHGLVKYKEDMKLFYPPDTEEIVNALESDALGKEGRLHELCGVSQNFTNVPARQSQSMAKYYVNGKVSKGYCGYHYPKDNMESTVHFSEASLPYLGVWITAGGYRGDYNCAFEPSNAFYDDIEKARKNKALPELAPKGKLTFALQIELNSKA